MPYVYVLYGKMDQYRDFGAPYQELVAAFDGLVKQGAPVERIQRCLKTEARILTRLIPSFQSPSVELELELECTAAAAAAAAIEKQEDDEEGEIEKGGSNESESEKNANSNDDRNTNSNSSITTGSNDAILTLAAERLMVAFRVFLRDFCAPQHPIVLVLDDLQWSDDNTLLLLEQILQEPNLSNFLLIGLYRDQGDETGNEKGAHSHTHNDKLKCLVDATFSFATNSHNQNQNQNKGIQSQSNYNYKCTVKDIPIGPLTLQGVDSLVGIMVDVHVDMDIHINIDNDNDIDKDVDSNPSSTSAAIAFDEESTVTTHTTTNTISTTNNVMDLSQWIHRKTLGNPYFVVQYLEMLYSKQFLRYNYETAAWEWTMAAIAQSTQVTDNVVDLLQTKVTQLPPTVLPVLVLAAFLGFMVDTTLLERLMQQQQHHHEELQHLAKEFLGLGKGQDQDQPQDQPQTTNKNDDNDNDVVSTSSDSLPVSVAKALQTACEEGLIELESSGDIAICRFSHDRIQECCYNLVPSTTKQQELHYRIGMAIWQEHQNLHQQHNDGKTANANANATLVDVEATPTPTATATATTIDRGSLMGTAKSTTTTTTTTTTSTDPAYIFLAADQLNRGAGFIQQDADRWFLVQLNYQASQAAKRSIGTEVARVFLEKAMEQVATLEHTNPKQQYSWDDQHYDLLLDLYSSAAEVEFRRGDFRRSEEHIGTVLAHARLKRHAVRALVSRALAHGVQRDFLQGIRESRNLLRVLGVKVPSSTTMNFLLELFKTKKALKRKTDADIVQMKDMDSPDMILAMKIMQHGSVYGWNSDTTFAGLCYLRMIRLTVKQGWCEATPYALAGYGFILASLGEEEEAFRFSQLALRASKSRRALPDVNMMVHAFLAHFERPAAQSLAPLLAGYRSGLETGDMMCGTICMSVYAHVYLFSGLALKSFAADLLQFAQQLKLCHQDLALAFVLPALQLALNLSGATTDPLDVSKESMRNLDGYNDGMFIDTSIEDPSVLFVYYLQAFSAFLLGNLDRAEEAMDRVYARKSQRLGGTQILNLFFLMVDGLIGFQLRRRKPASKHKNLAKAAVRTLKALSKKRSINCIGIFALLEAEEASFTERNKDALRTKYAYAIRQLSRSGFLHFTGIANELAGVMMKLRGDDFWSEHFLVQAWQSYSEWGATVKVKQMTGDYPAIDFPKRLVDQRTAGVLHGRVKYDANIDSIASQRLSRNSFVHNSLSTLSLEPPRIISTLATE